MFSPCKHTVMELGAHKLKILPQYISREHNSIQSLLGEGGEELLGLSRWELLTGDIFQGPLLWTSVGLLDFNELLALRPQRARLTITVTGFGKFSKAPSIISTEIPDIEAFPGMQLGG